MRLELLYSLIILRRFLHCGKPRPAEPEVSGGVAAAVVNERYYFFSVHEVSLTARTDIARAITGQELIDKILKLVLPH